MKTKRIGINFPEELEEALLSLGDLNLTESLIEASLDYARRHGRPLADFPSLESRRAARVEALRRASAARWERKEKP